MIPDCNIYTVIGMCFILAWVLAFITIIALDWYFDKRLKAVPSQVKVVKDDSDSTYYVVCRTNKGPVVIGNVVKKGAHSWVYTYDETSGLSKTKYAAISKVKELYEAT